jgi:hypothetical protein
MEHITISYNADQEFGDEVLKTIQSKGFDAYTKLSRVQGAIPLDQIVIAMGSAGAFSAIKDVIGSVLGKHTQKSIYVKYKGTEIKLEGLSKKESLDVLEKLFENTSAKKKK